MTVYEKIQAQIDALVEQGRNSVPGVREQCYKEAQRLRDYIDNMPIEEAEAEA